MWFVWTSAIHLFSFFPFTYFFYIFFSWVSCIWARIPINKFKETSLKVKWCKVKMRRKLRMTLIKSNRIDLDVFFLLSWKQRKSFYFKYIYFESGLDWTKWKRYKWFFGIGISLNSLIVSCRSTINALFGL